MRRFNIGERYINWIKALYKGGQACIITNGHKSSFFSETRGLLQGEAISGFLYILQAEPFNQRIRNDKNIHGIVIRQEPPKIESKLSAFMDDTSIHLGNMKDIPIVLKTINEFENISGSKLNVAKTKGVVFKEENTGKHHGIDCIYDKEKVLGIFIGKNVDLNIIWQELREKAEKTLNAWQKRDITLYGKILLIKTFGMSKIMYNLSMQTFTDQQLETFNKTMYDFLWNGKQRFMARDICEQKQSEGGLFMPNIYDVKKCMRIRWVIRTLINHQINNDRTSTIIPMKYFTCLDKQYGTYLYALRVDDCKDKIM